MNRKDNRCNEKRKRIKIPGNCRMLFFFFLSRMILACSGTVSFLSQSGRFNDLLLENVMSSEVENSLNIMHKNVM